MFDRIKLFKGAPGGANLYTDDEILQMAQQLGHADIRIIVQAKVPVGHFPKTGKVQWGWRRLSREAGEFKIRFSHWSLVWNLLNALPPLIRKHREDQPK